MWKIVLALIILASTFGAGWYYAPGKTVEVEKIVTRTDVVEKVVTRTIERKPDGTVIEIVKEEDRKETSNSKETNTRPGNGSRDDYRLGARYWVGSTADLLRPGLDRVGISLGKRIAGPVWLEAEINKREVAVGVSVTW